MKTIDITVVFTLLATLSVATQKLTEIFKAWIPGLKTPDTPSANPADDERRQRWVQVVAGISGILTTWAAWPAIKSSEIGQTFSGYGGGEQVLLIIVLGLMASGGSGPWNDLTAWMKNLKDGSKPAPGVPTGAGK